MLRNQKLIAVSLGLFLLLALAPLASAQGVTVQVTDHPELGKILTDDQGMTLYLYTRDGENVSNCYDQCAVNWPPLLVEEGQEPVAGPGLTGELSVIDRTDGGRQVAYNGVPLYFWIRDVRPGDATGQGVGDVWFVLSPETTAAALTGPAAQAQPEAQATPETPAVLPQTGGALASWTMLWLIMGGAALLGMGLGLALVLRAR